MTQAKFVRRLTSEAAEKPQKLVDLVFYHVYSIWLFTYSDIHIMLLPETAFGVLHALWFTENNSSSLVGPTSKDVFERAPLVLYWVWINLLAFNISNQRGPESIAEDAINKPWRTMPSGRWSPELASYGHKLAYSAALISSWFIGGLRPCIILTILGFWYNDCGGGDGRAITRNFINAMGFTSFGLGALEVALNQPLNFTAATLLDMSSPNLEQWILLLAVAVLSTVHMQDMHDQEGDKARGRSTMPLQIGDAPARWIIVGFMLLWGVVCPLFWRCGLLGYAMSTSIAYTVVFRSFFLRTVKEDRMTFAIWNLWMVSLYSLPLERLVNGYITSLGMIETPSLH
ncbi:UbiA prenyltransferase family-domain-containing protein [Xylaria acuta]|nr:UbiA prenyltransferase family-domain-containing protein [Xylaria acuta]